MKTTRLAIALGSLALSLGLASTASTALPTANSERGSSLVSDVTLKRDANAKKGHEKHAKAEEPKRKKVLKKHAHTHKHGHKAKAAHASAKKHVKKVAKKSPSHKHAKKKDPKKV